MATDAADPLDERVHIQQAIFLATLCHHKPALVLNALRTRLGGGDQHVHYLSCMRARQHGNVRGVI